MAQQTFPLNDLERTVKMITQEQKNHPQVPKKTEDSNVASNSTWQHFTVICSTNIVTKIKAIARTEGFSIRDAVEKFLSDGILRYENKHGAIITSHKKKIEDVL